MASTMSSLSPSEVSKKIKIKINSQNQPISLQKCNTAFPLLFPKTKKPFYFRTMCHRPKIQSTFPIGRIIPTWNCQAAECRNANQFLMFRFLHHKLSSFRVVVLLSEYFYFSSISFNLCHLTVVNLCDAMWQSSDSVLFCYWLVEPDFFFG